MAISDTIIGRLIKGSIYEHASKWAIPGSIFQLVMSFLLIGAISEDYLATNVNLLCNSSNLLVSILMAFCNSSPDLISNFVAWYSAAKEGDNQTTTADTLAVSEVLGACGTIMFIAVGFVLIGFNKLYKNINRQKFETEEIKKNNSINGGDNATNLITNQSRNEEENIIDSFCDDLNNDKYKSELTSLMIPLINKLSNDLFFFSIGMSLLLLCCALETVNMFVCLALLFLYTGYMLNNIRYHRKHGNNLIDYEVAAEDFIELQPTSDFFEDDQQQEADAIFKQQAQPSSFLGTDNFEFFLSVIEGDDTKVWRDNDLNNILDSTQGIELQLSNSKVIQLRSENDPVFDYYSDNPLEEDAVPNTPIIYEDLKNEYFGIFSGFISKMLPFILPYYKKFQKKNIVQKIILILTTPVLILITFTCPRFSRSIPKDNQIFLFLTIQCYMSTFFSVFLLMVFVNKLSIWPLVVFPIIFGSALLYIQFTMRNKYKQMSKLSLNNPFASIDNNDNINKADRIDSENVENEDEDDSAAGRNINSLVLLDEFRKELSIFSILGILNSIFWIVIMSNNLIGTIEYYQEIFGISETILGMTFFAWGNSVPDILTNVAVLKLYNKNIPEQLLDNSEILYKWLVQSLIKYSHISLVTCISSSTINSMIGVGFNALVAICLKRPFKMSWKFYDIGPQTRIHLLVSASSILITMFLIASVLKIIVKYDKIFKKIIIDGYLTNKTLLIDSVIETLTTENNNNNDLDVQETSDFNNNTANKRHSIKYKHNRAMKYIGLSLISIWITVTLINVLIEVIM